MKKSWLPFLAGIFFACQAHAADRTGVLSLDYTVGPNFIVGGSNARDVGTVEPGVGADLLFGLAHNLEFVFGYDYLDADLRTQALTFGGQWLVTPEAAWSPLIGAGLGFGKPVSGIGWGHFAFKLTGGLEHPLNDSVSIAAVASYEYVDGPDPFGSVHAIEPGVRLTYHFGNVRLPTR